MKFGRAQRLRFGSGDGSYSRVTERENYDSQITLADYEAALVISHFGRENIQVGNVSSNREKAKKRFLLFPTHEEIVLNVVYPKKEKTELRLYISSKAGFKPDGGEIWFMFLREREIWIGSMTEGQWRRESSGLKKDVDDFLYQESLDETDEINISTLQARDAFARSRAIAINRLEISGYTCEYNPKHKLFISRYSKKPYIEAHHLIPISLQNEFGSPLDTVDNVFSLCPYCHRAVHHAEENTARDILETLASRREVLDSFDLCVPDLFSIYAVETIE